MNPSEIVESLHELANIELDKQEYIPFFLSKCIYGFPELNRN
jgi:hypothetical protein